jgi:hypothetical protein
MLLAEEVAAHKQLTSSSAGGSSSGSSLFHAALLKLLDAASHQQALLQHAECVLAPALQVMQQMFAQQQLQAQQLEADNARLKVWRWWRLHIRPATVLVPMLNFHSWDLLMLRACHHDQLFFCCSNVCAAHACVLLLGWITAHA